MHKYLCFIISLFFFPFVEVNSFSLEQVAYYVSSSTGNDSNDGRTPDSPKKTISSIKSKENVIINLKRGDCFFENIVGYKNSVVQPYGQGEKPILCGFKILANPKAWKYDRRKKAWVIDLSVESNFRGFLNTSGESRFNNVGVIYDSKNDKIYGHKVKALSMLQNEGDFFQTESFKSNEITKETFSKLYIRMRQNPNTKGNLCFSMARNGIQDMTNCVIDNLAIVGFSQHGINNCNGCMIKECNIDIIGGSAQIGVTQWVRYGNGIEFWSPQSNNTVTGCIISRTFDCGATIQASGKIEGDSKNNRFTKNYFYKCRQAFEFFLNPSDGYKSNYVNCSFDNNVCYLCGDNEFSSTEWRDACFLTYDKSAKNISLRNNVIYGSNYYCGYVYPKGLRDNTVYIYSDQYLNHAHDKADKPVIWSRNTTDVQSFKLRSGDNSKITIITKGSNEDRRMKTQISAMFDWHQVFTYDYVSRTLHK